MILVPVRQNDPPQLAVERFLDLRRAVRRPGVDQGQLVAVPPQIGRPHREAEHAQTRQYLDHIHAPTCTVALATMR